MTKQVDIESYRRLETMRQIGEYNSQNLPLKRGAWSPEEDQKLIAYINKHGIWNWTEMPIAAGLLRSGKSCRLRWMNYLRPDIKRGKFSMEEVETILKLHEILGNRWSAIAANLPGRTDNEIKNFWHTHLKKNYLSNNINSSSVQAQGTQTSELAESKRRKLSETDVGLPTAPKILKSEDSIGSLKLPTANFSSSLNVVNDLTINENQITEENVGLLDLTEEQCLWVQPFSTDGHMCKVHDYGDTCNVEIWVQELLHGV